MHLVGRRSKRDLRRPRFSVLAGLVAAACSHHSALLAPTARDLARPAPDSFLVAFQTTRGEMDVLMRRSWSPAGVDRVYFLVRHGYYDGARFYRVVPNYAQFGLAAEPFLSAEWQARRLPDEPVRGSNRRGAVSFARGGPGTRSVQLFVNRTENVRLDTLNTFGFPPVGEVTAGGMAVVDSLYAGYGEMSPRGPGPSQDSVRLQGEAYLQRRFPRLDAITRARVTREWR
jgi:peptidyl-prolyl cis-trans isomerase A (cyclophilin A)